MMQLVAERELSIWHTQQANSTSRRFCNGLKQSVHQTVLGLLMFVFALAYSTSSSALGVGAAESDSYIGQPLSVRIPIFNVTDPNSLSITFESTQFDGEGQAKVNAVLDRSNSQLSILVSSDAVINEPYVGFTLDIVDGSSEFSKDFVILMDLPAKGFEQIGRAPVPSNAAQTNVPRNSLAPSASSVIPQSSDSVQIDRVMGPYETAEAGRIPKKFGAVLDGQSIWRVARRINEAMGVSKSQMIWALYQANPSAFSSKSITSLKAGVFLTIPPQSTVAAVSDAQAQANLRALRNNSESSVNTASRPNVESTPVAEALLADSANSEFDLSTDSQSDASTATEDAPTDGGEGTAEPFQVSGIDSAGQQNGVAIDSQSKAIIASLTETVSSMSQQLDRKDKKIQFLESQVKELSSFIASENPTGVATSEAPELVQDLAIQDSLAVNSEPLQGKSAQDSNATLISVLKWGLLGLIGISVLAYLFRTRLLAVGRSLNLFGSNEHVELRTVAVEVDGPIDFDSVDDIDLDTQLAYEQVNSVINQKAGAVISETAEPIERPTERPIERNRDIPSVVKESLVNSDTLSSMPYLGMAEDDDEDQAALEFEIETLEDELDKVENDEVSFDERFEQLLNEKDFDFARELLDFARYNEINDERYHCERLRLCEKMKDEDAFYEYYYEIESKISSFPPNLQTQISQLVVQLAHH